MESKELTLTKSEFAKDVEHGLAQNPKTLSSKYFYDEKGSKIFESIMNLKEYYLTDCEYEIFSLQKQELLEAFSEGVKSFNLIELGAGNGAKTKLLLDHFVEQGVDFSYTPMDISEEILLNLTDSLKSKHPKLEVTPIAGDYHQELKRLPKSRKERNIILFLGANIGNYSKERALKLYQLISSNMSSNDMVLTGFDLRKDPKVVLSAYDDPYGVTKSFNINLLDRMNRELGANFNLPGFDHYPMYDVETGEARSYIVSLKQQSVYFEALDKSIDFQQWEYMHTEISKKYSFEEIEDLAHGTGFSLKKNFLDCRWYFANSLWTMLD